MKQQLISLFFCGVLLLQGCTEKKNEAQLEKTLSVYQVDLKSESPKESIDRFLAGMEIRLYLWSRETVSCLKAPPLPSIWQMMIYSF